MKPIKTIILFATLLTLPALSFAQEDGSKGLYVQYQLEIVLGLGALVCIVAVVTLITVLIALRTVLNASRAESTTTESELILPKPGEEGVGFWRKVWNRLNDSVPVTQEDTIMTSHEYDGIRELDNRLPPWWLYGFYFTIFFGVVYLLNFHVFKTGDLQQAEYEKEMAEAKASVEAYLASQENLIDESSVTFASEDYELLAGEEIFTSLCAACHAADGGGGVGPNLTDQYWIHGGSIQDIFSTIKYGVPQKGMISWQSQLSPKEMQQVASFIYTLEGTSPANPKDPQGEVFEREEQSVEQDSVAQEPQVLEAGV